MNSQLVRFGAFAAVAALGWSFARQDKSPLVIDAQLHHLGNDPTPDWREASKDPEGTRLDLKFRAKANEGEWVLFLEQRSVGEKWHLRINGEEVATLRKVDERATRYYLVPPKVLRDGDNELSIVPDVPTDDIVVGNIRLHACSLRELYDLTPVEVRVLDSATNKAVPARVTIVDSAGVLAPIYYGESETTAVRDGVIYVATEPARIELPPGEYTAYATRGVEWSLAQAPLVVTRATVQSLQLGIRRELDTTGYIACDTHVHTVTFSGHGDSSVEERQLTLAGEGVELAVATDHNHNTDYRPYQKKLELGAYFTSVVGNEVTTEVGHFNGFPLDPSAAIPPHDSKDYVQIVDGIRAKGAKVVILNHPRWPDHAKGPFGVHALDHATGARTPELKLTVDATELINATCDEKEPMLLFSDWFALLNRGERIFAVGSSDSHTVGDPVGQGRTYIPSATDDPANIDVEAACEAIKNGRTSIGMGMFVTIAVDENYSAKHSMGDTIDATKNDKQLIASIRVQAPSWATPRKATLFMNGLVVGEHKLVEGEKISGTPTDASFALSFKPPAEHDAWLVCVVTGDAVTGPYWKTLNAYTIAATNPVFIDRDGGGYQSPRETAAKLLASDATTDDVRAALEHSDQAVTAHVLDLAREQWRAQGQSESDIERSLATFERGSQRRAR